MKVISLTQPWATLVIIGAKRIETRSWSYSHRGPLVIHAAKAFPGSAKDLCLTDYFRRALGWPDPPSPLTQVWLDDIAARTKALPLGSIIGACELVDCCPSVDFIPNPAFPSIFRKYPTLDTPKRAFGNYAAGRYGFLIEGARQIEPTPAKGGQRIWNWEGEI